jgi:hypothetical protein
MAGAILAQRHPPCQRSPPRAKRDFISGMIFSENRCTLFRIMP